MALLVVVTLVTDYIVLGTVGVTIVTPVGMWFLSHSLVGILILCIASVVILWKHRENYVRIWNRTEIGLRSAARGENRVK